MSNESPNNMTLVQMQMLNRLLVCVQSAVEEQIKKLQSHGVHSFNTANWADTFEALRQVTYFSSGISELLSQQALNAAFEQLADTMPPSIGGDRFVHSIRVSSTVSQSNVTETHGSGPKKRNP
jgi:hypothetical protein